MTRVDMCDAGHCPDVVGHMPGLSGGVRFGGRQIKNISLRDWICQGGDGLAGNRQKLTSPVLDRARGHAPRSGLYGDVWHARLFFLGSDEKQRALRVSVLMNYKLVRTALLHKLELICTRLRVARTPVCVVRTLSNRIELAGTSEGGSPYTSASAHTGPLHRLAAAAVVSRPMSRTE